MAQQTSIITLNGTVGGLSFYKTKNGHFARTKGGVSKSRIMSDPKYARTRENLREFSEAAAGAKLFRDSMRQAVLKSSDSRLHNRLYSTMIKIVKSDPVNNRGDRKVMEGDWGILQGMELNGQTNLKATVLMEFSLTDSVTELLVGFPDFNPVDFLTIPEGTTHFRFFGYGVSVDFVTGERSSVMAESSLLPVREEVVGLSLALDKAGLVQSHRAFVLGVEFAQEVNGVEYAMNNGAHNAAAILLTETV